MGIGNSQQQEQPPPQQQQQPISTRSALRRAGMGEIVEVQGGHIVRATGRKDRHSKVCTAKGPRDRRVRLSAHTAIQFYDVQDRLGYDRPSKAVDWLIKKAKTAIDELDQLPAWSPTNVSVSNVSKRRGRGFDKGGVASMEEEEDEGEATGAGEMFGGAHKHQHHQQQEVEEQHHIYNNANSSNSSLLPPSLDSDAIADTIKSFFPMDGVGRTTTTSSTSPQQMHFEDYSQSGLLSRSGGGGGNSRQSQDLRLSLQSFQQDPLLMHSHQQAAHDGQQSVFHGASPIGFHNSNVGWAAQPSSDMGRLHRVMASGTNDTGTDQHGASGVGIGSHGGGGVGFMFNPPPLLQPLFVGHHNHSSQFLTQRGPLQSSYTPSIRAWIGDPLVASMAENHQVSVHPQTLASIGFASGGFSGFHIPTRIQGEEEHDGDPNKPSSATSGSRH